MWFTPTTWEPPLSISDTFSCTDNRLSLDYLFLFYTINSYIKIKSIKHLKYALEKVYYLQFLLKLMKVSYEHHKIKNCDHPFSSLQFPQTGDGGN